jgi:hypothetical protein
MELINVAIFNFPWEAAIVASLLSAEGIVHALNHEHAAIFVPGSGVTLSVCDGDVERAAQIIREAGWGRNLLLPS